jgi:hypothetical protein
MSVEHCKKPQQNYHAFKRQQNAVDGSQPIVMNTGMYSGRKHTPCALHDISFLFMYSHGNKNINF